MRNYRYDWRTYQKYQEALERYAKLVYREITEPDDVLIYETKDHLRLPPEDSACSKAVKGTEWGGEYDNIWLKFSYTVPKEYDGRALFIIPQTDAIEYLCFRNGKPNGIINQKNDFLGGGHSAFLIANPAKAGEKIDVAIECYAGHSCFGCYPHENYGRDEENDRDSFKRVYKKIGICVREDDIWDFCFDLSTVFELAAIGEKNFASIKAREALFDAFPYFIEDTCDHDYDELIESCKKVREIIAPALEKGDTDPTRGYVGVVGHSHMDTAWLWPISETIRKCARTYSKALSAMEYYPDYNFVQSSALHTYWMEKYYPDIFARIKKRVAENRYEPNGGVWVECDCNVTGGESMIRQFLYGQMYTKEKFGYLSNTFWLPDTFGYSAAIPQIMQGCCVKYFCTTKIGWNDCNDVTDDTFIWRGLDGSEVLTHFNEISAIPDVSRTTACINDINNKRVNNSKLLAIGYGDGGGGPTFGMLEYFKRTKDLPGMPVMEPVTVGSFMDTLNKRRDKYPVFDGELYLEFHRGTLTSMHDVKKLNREAEIALHNFELFNVLSGKKEDERHEELYKTLLQNQFHDILPGTCIDDVYDTEIPEMKKLISDVNELTDSYAAEMTDKSYSGKSVFNPMGLDCDTVIAIKGENGVAGKNAQTYKDIDGEEFTAVEVNIPAMSSVKIELTAPKNTESAFKFDGKKLITPYYIAEIDSNGYISSLIDKENNREIANVKGAPLGTLWFGEDFPTTFDNWEVEDDIFRKLFPAKASKAPEVVSDGAVEFRYRTEYKLESSTAYVDTVFYANSRLVEYEMKVDWKTKHRLLKAGFDVNVRSAFVKNEIQFGHIDRPTTRNNTLEMAKFEVVNHKWSDLSETSYGVAVLNDCKYGISVEGSDMRLTLDKGGIRPAYRTAFGVHYMRYALLPHVGPFNAETVIRPAYSFNYRPIQFNGSLNVPALFTVDKTNIIAEAVKNAENNDNAYVIRLYEAERSTTTCKLNVKDAKHIYVSNMLEEVENELIPDNGTVELTFRPFEIKTIIVER